MYTVYQHTNVLNSKTYIGITKHTDPNKRWKCGNGYKTNSLFYKAVYKYGWGNFTHIVLNSDLSKQEAIDLEIKLIKQYKELNLSYNIGNGGEGSASFSEETINKLKLYTGDKTSFYGKHHTLEAKEKISSSNIGRIVTKETRLKIGKANRGENNGMYGKEVPDYIRKQTSNRFSKPVLLYSLNLEFIAEYSSSTEALKTLNININHIGTCCKNLRKTCGGYIWKYKENDNGKNN